MAQVTNTPSDIITQKKRLRSELAERRNLSFSGNQRPESLKLIPQQSWFQEAKIISVYVSQSFEFPTEELFKLCVAHRKEVCVPVMRGRDMIFQRIDTFKNLVPNEKGILEPIFGIEISPSNIDVFFVPLTAFDRSGNRLGRGVGYYDRLFSNENVRGVKVGVGFEFQEFFSVPTDEHDIPMQYILTENRLHKAF